MNSFNVLRKPCGITFLLNNLFLLEKCCIFANKTLNMLRELQMKN